MKNIKTITVVALLFSLFVLLFSFLELAALHDINNDYVSQEIQTDFEITSSVSLPDWTKTEGEWQIVTISLFLRFLFLIFNISVLIYLYKKYLPTKVTLK